jgi:hypothetical protein
MFYGELRGIFHMYLINKIKIENEIFGLRVSREFSALGQAFDASFRQAFPKLGHVESGSPVL